MRISIIAFSLVLMALSTQAQSNIDSLWGIWNDTSANPEVRLETIDVLIFEGYLFNKPDSAYILAGKMLELATKINSKEKIAASTSLQGGSFYFRSEYDSALYYFNKAIPLYEEAGNLRAVGSVFGNMGNIYTEQGDYIKGIDAYMRSLRAHEKNDYQKGIAIQLNNIGIVHKDLGDPEEAMKYFERALAVQVELNYEMGQADCQLNMASIHIEGGNHQAALPLLDRCGEIYKTVDDKQGKAMMHSMYGKIYFQDEDYDQALLNFNQALSLHQEMEDDRFIATALVDIGQVYSSKGQANLAITQYEKAKKIGQDAGAIAPVLNATNYLSKAYQEMGSLAKSVENYALYVKLTDSTRNEENQLALLRQEYNYTYEKKAFQDSIMKAEELLVVELAYEKELRRKDTTRNIAIGSGMILLVLAGSLFSRNRYINKSRDIISREKDRSESLLLNILPADIAKELKEKGKADARDFDLVSILFTDFKGFTAASEELSAQDLVTEINACFEAFDGMIAKYGIEKIKTIGDAYMAAGGLPIPSDDSVKNTVLTALEMQSFISKRKKEMDAAGKPAFEMRVGIHTGPVVAGIVGVKKFQYDIWGDTVNTASRMESNGRVDQVNVSQATYDLLKDDPDFRFKSRGKIEAKGKGEIEMYFVYKN
jgi:class 3 adenylate cyclase/Tfp pilus assembly protein PilF